MPEPKYAFYYPHLGIKYEANNNQNHPISFYSGHKSATEALLLAPYNRANVMFFHSKLNIHNFTFYDLKTKVVLNYVWPEVSGDIEAPNFTTCYIDYLTNVLENNPSCSQIIIWSDGCTYQNRCNILASAILTFAVENNVTIYHKYLEVGHTHMECDSVHSTIEGAIKRS